MKSNLQEILRKVANRRGVSRQMDAAHACEKYRQIAASILGPQALDYTNSKSYKNKTLTIAVQNSAWAQEVHMHKHELLEALQLKFHPLPLTKINITIENLKIA